MSDVDQLLSVPEIEEFMRTHKSAEDRVRDAAKLLVENTQDKMERVKALKKLLPSLGKNKINIFFSYKKRDESAAKEVVEVLRTYSAQKLEIIYQAEFTEDIVGKRWREKLRDVIPRANWFILLFPDASDDWDWCLYETGMFEAHLTSADRLICLHHPDTKIPNAIEDYHAVPATIPEFEKFLRMVFVKKNPLFGMEPINNSLTPERISELAKKLVKAIRCPKRYLFHRIYEPCIELKIENLSDLQNKDDLDRAIVLNANREALRLFDFELKPSTWGELRSGLAKGEEDERWLEELFKVIMKIADKRQYESIEAVFKTKGGELFRPVTWAVDRIGAEDGPIEKIHIAFREEASAIDISTIPRDVAVLASSLRYAFRFRWEILEQFSIGPMTDADVEQLDNALKRLRVDVRSRGLIDINVLLSFFPPEQANRIIEMFNNWRQLSNPEQKGELDVALKNKEVDKIHEILARVKPMSQEFLEMAANRFSDLVSKISTKDA